MPPEEDTASLIFFKDQIHQAVELVPKMSSKEKLHAVQFWNQISEHLQVIVNNSAAEINALASYQNEVLEKNTSSMSTSLEKTTDNITPDHLMPILDKNGLDFAELGMEDNSQPRTSSRLDASYSLQASSSIISSYIPTSNTLEDQMNLHHLLSNTSNNGIQMTARLPDQPLMPNSLGVLSNPSIQSEIAHLPSSSTASEQMLSQNDHLIYPYERSNVIQSSENTMLSHMSPAPISAIPGNCSTAMHSSANSTATNMAAPSNLEICKSVVENPLPSSSNETEQVKKTLNDKHKCEQCGARFSSRSGLLAHNRTHTGEKPFICNTCPSAFSSKNNLLRHLQSHAGLKRFECEVCKLKFTAKKTLKIHMRRHTGEKPYKCDECGSAFSQSSVLKAHLETHGQLKRYSCEICGKAFKQNSQLRIHRSRHKANKKWDCGQCEAKFVTKADFVRHERTHTGEKPYSCSLCGKCFTRQQTLNEHSNRHYGIKPYACSYCDKQFAEMSGYHKHLKTHKKKNDPLISNITVSMSAIGETNVSMQANTPICYYPPMDVNSQYQSNTISIEKQNNNVPVGGNESGIQFLDLDTIQDIEPQPDYTAIGML